MGETNKSLRINTKVDGSVDSYVLNVNLEQEYKTLDVLSLKINQIGSYRYHVSDYGVLVGRVLANNGFGVPNARLSLFIDKKNTTDVIKNALYPYEDIMSKNEKGIRYNLLPDRQKDDCHQIIGTFPNKRVMLDDTNMLEIFDEYYKYTTRTNDAGDYMFFGIPTGSYTLHMDLDISDCGKLSQRPRDFVYKGYTIEQFENANQFKIDSELSSLAQVFTQDVTVDIKPFWGDANEGTQIGISRKDIDVAFKFEPTCVFMGSIVSDNPNEGISQKCVPTNRMGEMGSLTTGPGRIEIIRKKLDNTIEELQIKGTQLINGNGVWCFQIPMNLDYMMTDEYGNMVPTDNPEKGIPTRCEVRFRLSMDEPNADLVNYHRGKVLVPHNPSSSLELDYNFGSKTKDVSFKSLMWNNVYTIKSFIPRFQRARIIMTDKFTGIKKVNMHGSNNPMPYNNIRIRLPFMFRLMCNIVKLFIRIIGFINKLKKMVMGVVGNLIDITLPYSYISNELCPDLENWFFAPEMQTTPTTKKNKKTCREWQNQSVCETFKEIAADMSTSSVNTIFYALKTEGFKGEGKKLDGSPLNLTGNTRSEGTTVTIVTKDNTNKQEEKRVLHEFITLDEYKALTGDTGETISKVIWYYAVKVEGDKNNENGYDTEISWEESGITYDKLYVKADTQTVQKYASSDTQSIGVQNALDKSETRINLTNNTNYLTQCVEINLAQEYEVIKFDFYNDWINGCVYLPRWAREVKYKRSRKKGGKLIPKKVKGCLNTATNYKTARRYVQQCSLHYGNDLTIKNENGCHWNGRKRCHERDGMDYITVMGDRSGVVSEVKTSLGQNIYYLKPYEFQNGRSVPFFATDIVMLGTLFDCNEYGLPSTFESLVSTTYQMPPQLALTNVDDDSELYYNLATSAPTPAQVKLWQCNSKCDKGGQMVTPFINTGGVVKQTPSYSDLDKIIAEYEDMSTTKQKYYRINTEDNGNIDVISDKVELDNDGTIKYLEKTYGIEKYTVYYKIEKNENEENTLEYEDIFPVTEMSGVDWSYNGVGYDGITTNDLLKPGGHFLGLSCDFAETTIKSCVNLKRACEIGTSLSTRFEVPIGFKKDDENEEKDKFDVVNYLFVAPNGLIAKDQVVDTTFRSAFATMNQNSLKTVVNEYGYKQYDFNFLIPDSFDGSLREKIGTSYTQPISPKEENYWGDYIDTLTAKTQGDLDYNIEKGFTIIRNSETKSDDYVKFRLGGTPRYLTGNAMPVYRNSFYFYFGLKDGFSALDEFKTQFYAPCAKNVMVGERGSINITIEYANEPREYKFNAICKVDGLEGPFVYDLTRNDTENLHQLVTGETPNYLSSTWKTVTDGVTKNGMLEHTTGGTIEGLFPGEYTLILTSAQGNEMTTNFVVGGKEWFGYTYDLSQVVDFFKDCPYDSTSLTGETPLWDKGDFGGYLLDANDFNADITKRYFTSQDVKTRTYYLLTFKHKSEGGDVDKNDEVTLSGFNSIKYFKRKKVVFNNSEHILYFWDDGTYEIWIRCCVGTINANNTITVSEPYFAYEYKIDEFNVNGGNEEINYYLEKDGIKISSKFLREIEQKYGKWWTKGQFIGNTENKLEVSGYSDDDFKDLYKLINTYGESQNTIKLTVDDSFSVKIIDGDGDIETVRSNGTFTCFTGNTYYGVCYDEHHNTFGNEYLYECKIENNILSTKDIGKDNFITYINNGKTNYWWNNVGENKIVTCSISNDNIKVEEIEKGNGILVFPNTLPVINRPISFKFIYIVKSEKNGDKRENFENLKVLTVYNNSFEYIVDGEDFLTRESDDSFESSIVFRFYPEDKEYIFGFDGGFTMWYKKRSNNIDVGGERITVDSNIVEGYDRESYYSFCDNIDGIGDAIDNIVYNARNYKYDNIGEEIKKMVFKQNKKLMRVHKVTLLNKSIDILFIILLEERES